MEEWKKKFQEKEKEVIFLLSLSINQKLYEEKRISYELFQNSQNFLLKKKEPKKG